MFKEVLPSAEVELLCMPNLATAFAILSLVVSCDRITNTPCREISTPRIFQSIRSVLPSIHVKNIRNQWKPNIIIFNLMMVMTLRVVRRLSWVNSFWPDVETLMLAVTLRTRSITIRMYIGPVKSSNLIQPLLMKHAYREYIGWSPETLTVWRTTDAISNTKGPSHE